MTARPTSFAESFLTYFDVALAQSQSQLEDVGRIRYRVYCEEFGYEPKENFPEGMEKDQFDANALHCLVTHKATNTPAGCVRVVKATGDDPLPFEKYCLDSLDGNFFENNPMPRETMCEVSRLAVDGMFRRRSGEQAYPVWRSAYLRTFPAGKTHLPTHSCILFSGGQHHGRHRRSHQPVRDDGTLLAEAAQALRHSFHKSWPGY